MSQVLYVAALISLNQKLVQMEHLLNCYVMVLHSVFALVLLCNCLLKELISHVVGVKHSLCMCFSGSQHSAGSY